MSKDMKEPAALATEGDLGMAINARQLVPRNELNQSMSNEISRNEAVFNFPKIEDDWMQNQRGNAKESQVNMRCESRESKTSLKTIGKSGKPGVLELNVPQADKSRIHRLN